MNERYDEANVGKFFKHLCMSYKKRMESTAARQDLKNHLQTVKQLSTNKDTKATEIRSALKELEAKIELALEKQGKVIKHVTEEQVVGNELLKKITNLERQVTGYLKQQQKRHHRIKQLEAKIRKKTKR
ncbi:MAG: hypothetical protein ABIF10_00645 [Candidatus Woesearchaeota archaeon]